LKSSTHLLAVIFITISLQGCFHDEDSKYCPSVEPVVDANSIFFADVSQGIEYVGSGEHQLAIACHNCYDNASEYTIETEMIIESAISHNTDLIELDVVMSDAEGKAAYISHESTTTGPLFSDVIANSLLINASQILFLEIKAQLDLKENVRELFRQLMAHKINDVTYAYFNSQRFTVIRSIETDKTLRRFREVLEENEFEQIRPFIKLSRLFYPKEESAMINEIGQVHSCGFHMIELDTRIGIESIKSLNAYADTLGLAVNVFTLDESNYSSFVNELKHDVDVITVETREFNNAQETSLFQKVRALLLTD